LTVTSNQLVLTDLESKAGTYVDQKRVHQHAFTSSGVFQAGNTQFHLVYESDLDAPTRMADDHSAPDVQSLIKQLHQKGSIDKYPLEKIINDGGRNLVFTTTDPESKKKRALKIIPTAAAGNEDQERFMRAMKMLQAVRNPSLVKLYKAGRRENFCWVLMEYFPKGSIDDRRDSHGIDGRLDWKDAWRVAYCISKSLEVLESNGISHRYIRPTNILYRESEDSWVLSDLVVAKAEDVSQTSAVTQHVFLPSNLAYTAPERLTGDSSIAPIVSDIYSLGAVLTEMLAGQPPFGYGQLKDILPRLREEPKRVTRDAQMGMNEMLMDLANRMAAPNAGDRYSTARELWDDVCRVGKLTGMKTV
jgi:serine/threonine protein kinase